MSRRAAGLKQFLMLVCLLLLSLWAASHLRCSSAATTAEHAAVATAYGLSLDQCKAAGKASGSFAVFEACERTESRKLCTERPQLRTAWPRCAEVGVMP